MASKKTSKSPAAATSENTVGQRGPSSPGDNRDRALRMARVAGRFDGWKPAVEVLRKVRAVPTRFIQIDRGTRVGGWPIDRFTTVHGPSNHGKTAFCHGLGLSFLERGHFYAFVDAEMTTPEDWLQDLMKGHERNPGFVALRPRSFEETVDKVREFCETVAEARVKGDIEPDTTGLICVDSIRKLVPTRLLEKIAKEGAEGKRGSVDGMGGRAAQYRAALNAQWLDELVPLLHSTGMGMVIIARETFDPLADPDDLTKGTAWQVQGGGGVIYDSSLVVRVTRECFIEEGPENERKVVGEKHQARIWKTKVGGKEEQFTDCWFHTSNGVARPAGFDEVLDVFDLAVELGVVEAAGAWFSFEGEKAQGAAKFIAKMRGSEAMYAQVEQACRASFAQKERADG